METLLAPAFDSLSSHDPQLMRKGLRHLEGILAKLCLTADPPAAAGPAATSSSSSSSAGTDTGSVAGGGTVGGEVSTAAPAAAAVPGRKGLPEDPALREFVKLQDGFEWNVASRLLACLDRIPKGRIDEQYDLILIQCLDLIQGVLLLHPASRRLFSCAGNMTNLLSLLNPSNSPATHSAALLTLVCALVDTPANTRKFERLGGLSVVTRLFKRRETSREVKMKTLEFLYFYLMPEEEEEDEEDEGEGEGQREGEGGKVSRSTEEKQVMLGKYIANVEALAADLKS